MMTKPKWLRGESVCVTCMRGAAADKKGETFYCSSKGGLKKQGEGRSEFLDRSMVEAKEECESYISRAWYEEE